MTLLGGIRAVNAARGLVGAVVGKMLIDLGAEVSRPVSDAPNQAAEYYPAYEALRAAESIILDGALKAAVAAADLLVHGGEDLGAAADRDIDWETLGRDNAALVRLVIGADPVRPGPAVDILAQARSGLTFEHYRDRATLMAFQPATYGAALQGLIGALAALVARRRTGEGQRVATSLYQGALAWVTTWGLAEQPTPAFRFNTPLDPRPLILRCADGDYIHIVMGSAGSKYQLYRILGIDDPSVAENDPGLPSKDDPPEKFYGDADRIAPYVAKRRRDALIVELAEAGVIAAPVLGPGECWDDGQVVHDRMARALPGGGAIVGAPAGIAISPTAGATPAWAGRPSSGRPLEGVRVLDFGAFTAGPLASLALSRLGADVVKVEPPTGDPCRNLTRAFFAANRGKRSIAIDMKTPRGRALAAELCAGADVVVSNFRTGVAAKLGIDSATLLARYPHLVVLECPAFGSSGPRAAEVAFDPLMQAFCGFEVRAGGIGNTPKWNRSFLADYGGGQIGSIAILAALDHRLRTGRGCALDVSLLRAAMVLQSETLRLADGSFVGAAPLDAEQAGFDTAERLYATRDGWIAIAVRDTAMAVALAETLAVEDLGDDWRAWDANDAAGIAAACAGRDSAWLVSALHAAGVWAERCDGDREEATLTDEALTRAGVVEHVDTPGLGRTSHIGSLFQLSDAPPPLARRAPAIGEDGAAVLHELGYDQAAVAELAEAKVIGAARAGLWA